MCYLLRCYSFVVVVTHNIEQSNPLYFFVKNFTHVTLDKSPIALITTLRGHCRRWCRTINRTSNAPIYCAIAFIFLVLSGLVSITHSCWRRFEFYKFIASFFSQKHTHTHQQKNFQARLHSDYTHDGTFLFLLQPPSTVIIFTEGK